MSDKNGRPIVIRRKKRGGERKHGAWKIAYADFMTAMMAFFLVMWLLSGFSQAEIAQISRYFRTPLKVALVGGDRNSASNSAIPGGGDNPLHSEGEVSLTQPQARNYEPNQGRRNARLKDFKQRLEAMIREEPSLKAMGSQLQVDLVPAGLRIQIIDTKERPMFRLGSAEVVPYLRRVLDRIAPMLNTVPNLITITGHTDDLRFASGEASYSNWELSAERANAARRALVAGGMNPDKVVRVLGAAATMRLPGKPPGAAVNRRISILVLNEHAQARILGRRDAKPEAPAAPRNPVRQLERVITTDADAVAEDGARAAKVSFAAANGNDADRTN